MKQFGDMRFKTGEFRDKRGRIVWKHKWELRRTPTIPADMWRPESDERDTVTPAEKLESSGKN